MGRTRTYILRRQVHKTWIDERENSANVIVELPSRPFLSPKTEVTIPALQFTTDLGTSTHKERHFPDRASCAMTGLGLPSAATWPTLPWQRSCLRPSYRWVPRQGNTHGKHRHRRNRDDNGLPDQPTLVWHAVLKSDVYLHRHHHRSPCEHAKSCGCMFSLVSL